jgi:hypothetical protein
MNKAGFLFLGAVLSIAGSSALLAGCGSDTTTSSTTTGSGGGSTTTTGSGGAGGSGGGATSTATATSTGTGMTATLDCKSYCTEVAANCTGANTQYTSDDSCMATCKAFTEGSVADMEGNTLGCRLYHGGAPAVTDPVTHCPHAGPTGGDKDVTDTTAGTCGEGCDAFCDVAVAVCTGANVQYATKEACLTECKTFKASAASFSTADTDKNDFGCRMYHLTVAATDAASATTHCPHIKAVSATCTK